MTKEECLKALQGYKELFELHQTDYYVPEKRREKFLNNFKCIENLIDEHFDNTPLKFEELKKDMWVWVKKLDGYYRISGVVDLTAENEKKYVDFGFGYIEFKENMFYRKQVQLWIVLIVLYQNQS